MLIMVSIIVSHRRPKPLLLLLYFLVLINVYSVVVRKVLVDVVVLSIIHHITVSKKTQAVHTLNEL